MLHLKLWKNPKSYDRILSMTETFFNDMYNLFEPDIFFESGTYLGYTAKEAAKVFPKVITIEIDPDTYRKAKELLANEPSVNLILGSSPDVIPNLPVDKKIFYFLDAHQIIYSDDSDKYGSCPLLAELENIKNLSVVDKRNIIIMIDDIRNLTHRRNYTYPTLDFVFDRLKEINPEASIIIIGDELLMYDKSYEITISDGIKFVTQELLLEKSEYQISDYTPSKSDTKFFNDLVQTYGSLPMFEKWSSL